MSIEVRRYTVDICTPCHNLEGEMCRTPGCAFCFRSMADVRELLTATLIRPTVDGELMEKLQKGTHVSGHRKKSAQ